MFALLCAVLLSGWSHGTDKQPDATCNILTGVVTGVGAGAAGTCAPNTPSTTCNGTTDDATAFHTFNTWAVGTWQVAHPGLLLQLTIPNGSTCEFVSQPAYTGTTAANPFAFNVANLRVSGYGATLQNGATHTGAGFTLGQLSIPIYHSALVATVAAGASCVTLLNPTGFANGSSPPTFINLFSTGIWTVLTGWDMQGSGSPPNPYYFDWLQVASVNVGTGVVCFTAPMKFSYKQTWPIYHPEDGLNPSNGGPATLYALDPSWNSFMEYRGLALDLQVSGVGQQIGGAGRSFTLRDARFIGGTNVPPSANMNHNWIGVDATNANSLEVDKMVTYLLMQNVTYPHQIYYQSNSVVDSVYLNGTHSDISGYPRHLHLAGVNLGTSNLGGGSQFGVLEEMDCTNSTLNTFSVASNGTPVSQMSTVTSTQITYPKAGNGPLPWAVPGANVFFNGGHQYQQPVFQITDATDDATNSYYAISTPGGWPGSGWPTIFGAQQITETQGPIVTTFLNCTGTDGRAADISTAPAGSVLSQRSQQTVDHVVTYTPILWGNLTSLTINVTTPYTGVMGPVQVGLTSAFVIESDWTTRTTWAPTVNAAVAGTRVITPTGATCNGSGTTGCSGDSLACSGGPGPPNTNPGCPGTIWIPKDQYQTWYVNKPSDLGATAVTITAVTNQGVVIPSPLP